MKSNMKRLNHVMVPYHEILSEEETEKLLNKYNISKIQLPKIFIDDPALKGLNAKVGDVIKITREDPVVGKNIAYRVVVDRKA